MNQLKRLKLLLGIKGEDKDEILVFAIARIEETIKNYCNLENVPAELENVVLSMAMELYRSENFEQKKAKSAALN